MATQPTALIAKHAAKPPVGAIDERIGDRGQVREQEQEPRHEGDGRGPVPVVSRFEGLRDVGDHAKAVASRKERQR